VTRRARVAIGLTLAGALGGGAAWWWSNRPGEVRREAGLDVLLITLDTLRADALGCYGSSRPGTSPAIDRLARAGVRFESAHAHNVLTLPSHANILSGRYPFEHGVRENAGFRFPADGETLATLLKRAGYRTAAFVSGFPLDSRFGLDRGFDVYDDSFADAKGAVDFVLPERSGAETVELARRFLDAPSSAPRFVWVHLYDPHTPYRAPEPFASRFASEPYYGEVAATDDAVGRLVAPLLEAGRAGGALVALTSDHGEGLGEHGEQTHGFFAYETTLRVPLVLFAPRLLAPRVVRSPARHVDLVPTVLDALGLPEPPGLAGRSLLPAAVGQAQAEVSSYFEALSGMLTRGWAPLYGVVEGREKLIELPLPELYDLGADPREATNLAAREPARMEALGGVLAGFRARDAGARPAEESAETRDRLAALGYVTAARAEIKETYGVEDDPKRLIELDAMMQEVVALQIRGQDREALARCRQVVERRPAMPAGWVQLAHIHSKLGETDQAIAVLRRAFELKPDELATVILLAGSLNDAGQPAEAELLLRAFVEREPPSADALVTRGIALAQLGRAKEALASFGRARELDPSNPMTLVQIATVLLTSGRDADARAALEQAIALNPDVALAHHTLGLVAVRQRDDALAERSFRRALELEPAGADTLLNLASLLARRGRATEARPLFEQFLRVAPPSLYGPAIEQTRRWLSRAS